MEYSDIKDGAKEKLDGWVDEDKVVYVWGIGGSAYCVVTLVQDKLNFIRAFSIGTSEDLTWSISVDKRV